MKRTTQDLRDQQKLYIFKNTHGDIKIGIARDVEKRRRNIETSSGIKTDLIKTFDTIASALTIEQLMHKSLDIYRKDQGEWFDGCILESIDFEYVLAEKRADPLAKEVGYAYRGLEIKEVDTLPLAYEDSPYSAWPTLDSKSNAMLTAVSEYDANSIYEVREMLRLIGNAKPVLSPYLGLKI